MDRRSSTPCVLRDMVSFWAAAPKDCFLPEKSETAREGDRQEWIVASVASTSFKHNLGRQISLNTQNLDSCKRRRRGRRKNRKEVELQLKESKAPASRRLMNGNWVDKLCFSLSLQFFLLKCYGIWFCPGRRSGPMPCSGGRSFMCGWWGSIYIGLDLFNT